MLGEEDIIRYSRQIMLDDIGQSGQLRLKTSSIAIVGVGGLGSAAALYLAAAGIGRLGLVDDDKVELTNLQRQILYRSTDLGKNKTGVASKALFELNPSCKTIPYQLRFSGTEAEDLVKQHDFILDCSDNFKTKFLINDICAANETPFSHAGILEYQGQVMTILPGKSACYRCVFEREPDEATARSRSYGGVLGVLPGIIGTIQAAEALKFLLGVGELLTDTLLTCDVRSMQFRRVNIQPNRDCPACCDAWNAINSD